MDNILEYWNNKLQDESIFRIIVLKNNKTKKAFKVAQIINKVDRNTFAGYSKSLRKTGYLYSVIYKGFILEEVEYVEETRANKSMAEMQREFLEKNKAKKLEDGGVELSDVERKSRGHRDTYRNESHYEALYDRLEVYDKDNSLIRFEYNKRIIRRWKGRTYYNVNFLDYDDNKRIYFGATYLITQNTIKDRLDSGRYTIEPKEVPVKLTADEDFYDEENFD